MIENKWKRFAMSQVLSDWGCDIGSAELFDLMLAADDRELERLFDEYCVLVWDKFEDMPNRWVVDHIESMAHAAQEVAQDDE